MASIAYVIVSIAVLLSLKALILCLPLDDDKGVCGDGRKIGDFPYMVSLRTQLEGFKQSLPTCAGSIVSNTFILTAARCHPDYGHVRSPGMAANLTVFVVDDLKNYNSGQRYNTKNFIFHPEFDGTGNSVALIELATPIQFTEYVKPIQLGREGLRKFEYVSTVGYIEAFSFANCLLNNATALTTSNLYCEKLFTTFDREWNSNFPQPIPITNKTVCTNGNTWISSLDHNIGSPLLQNNTLVGVAAWHSDTDFPSIYLSISEYADWIEKTISA